MREAEPGFGPSSAVEGCAESGQTAWDWCSLSAAEAARRLGTAPRRGLGAAEVARRTERDGPNLLWERPPPGVVWLFARQFTDIAVIALMVAALVAVVLGWEERRGDTLLHRFGDAIAIGIIVLLNAVIGFVQERKAERALRALRQLGAPAAKVLRDGRLLQIPASELVQGDVIEIREGDRVPADARLVDTSDLIVSEAPLTGESVPVDKLELGELSPRAPLAERSNMIFLGTHVFRGHARALVVATGMRTELGRIAELLGEVEQPQTPLQRSLQRFSAWVVTGCALLAVVVFVIGWIRLEASLGFLLLTAVSLAVAAIPEGLPAVTTIVLALGVQRMAKTHALVRRLAAVETLGSADVICTDKTGTLTQNRMMVRRVRLGARGYDVSDHAGLVTLRASSGESAPSRLLEDLLVACATAPAAHLPDDGGSPRGDPTDAALLRLHRGLCRGAALGELETVRVLPFDRERKLATVVISDADGVTGYSHGAPEAVLARVGFLAADEGEQPMTQEQRGALSALVDRWAGEGLRVIAVARTPRGRLTLEQASSLEREELLPLVEQDSTLVALVGIADPPRPEVPSAIARAAAAGVRTLMITGDHPLTAAAIAREIGILRDRSAVVTGPELDAMTASELDERIERVRVVARATAENKLRLVEALKGRGHTVAMTGDGVNDAPAIKSASIGIAMGRAGTDVTREAADMVLMDDNYATIVHAVEEGRIVYGNIKRFIVFLFAVNAGLVLAVLFGAFFGWPPILTPTQILWINLITNGLPALALGMEPVQLDPMRNPPREQSERLVSASELAHLLAYGSVMAVLGMATFAVLHDATLEGSLVRARTATFTVLALSPLFHALTSRSRRDSLFTLGPASNRWLLAAFLLALFLQAVALYVPGVQDVFSTEALDAWTLGAVLGVSSLVWVVGELEKGARRLAARLGARGAGDAPGGSATQALRK